MNIYFSHPTNLLFLFFIPVVIFLHFLSLKSKRKKALIFSNFEAIAKIKGIDLYSKNLTVLSITIVITLLLTLTLSGASIGLDKQVSSFSFIIALDSSGSMGANDILPTRLDAAKSAAIDFVNSMPLGTKIGVVSFSGSTFIMQELTSDKSLLRNAINNIQISSIGGTDLYDAILTSSNLLNNEDKKAIILLSDGRFNVGNIQDAIKYASDREVVVHTMAVGTVEGGSTDSGGISTLEQDSLRAISLNTQGNYFSASNNDEMLKSFDDIKQIRIGRVEIELSSYFLVASILLIVLEFILVNTKYKVFP